MSKTDTALSLVVLGGAALIGYGLYKKFVKPVGGVLDSAGGFLGGVSAGVGGTPPSEHTPEYVSGLKSEQTLENWAFFPFNKIFPSLPGGTPTQGEIDRHLNLVSEYLVRHPAGDYYADYPETAWIQPYLPAPVMDVAVPKSYNAYDAFHFIGGVGYDFGGRSSDSIIQQALNSGWSG